MTILEAVALSEVSIFQELDCYVYDNVKARYMILRANSHWTRFIVYKMGDYCGTYRGTDQLP